MRKISLFIVSALLILTIVLGTSCSIITNTTSNATSNQPVVEQTSATGINTNTVTSTSTNSNTFSIPESQSSPVLPNIADVVAKVKPAVVVINIEYTGYDFFNRPTVQQGSGSGFIISPDGYIVTNNHVVQDADTISVVLDDGRSFDGTVVGTDPLSDMAVIKIDATNLPVVTLGNSDTLRVGDWVVANGNSLGEGISATNGIVSAKDVSLDMSADQTLYDLIQTNASINPGNSGGPLVDMSGDVIGITSAKVAEVGVEGMGYAISINSAKPIIEQLINQGHAVHPWLGASLYTVDDYVISRFNLGVDKGALLVQIAQNSPASKAGLQAYDVITEFNGQPVTNVDDLVKELHDSQVGQQVKIVYWHGKDQHTTTLTLTERPQTNS